MTELQIAVLVERGTNPTEFNYARLRLREAGAQVIVVGIDRYEYELEDHSLGRVDEVVSSVSGHPFDGVVIPGGLGPEKLRQDPRIIALVKSCYERTKICAAICHGQQVLISAGLMRGVRATAAWSMMDDLREVGTIVPRGERAIRDGQIVTAIFPDDLPQFFQLVFEALAELEGWLAPSGYPERLSGRRWGIVVDNATDATQAHYLKLRVQEEGGEALFLGRQQGQDVRLSSPRWEWGDMSWQTRVDRALADPGVINSCDTEAELDSRAVRAEDLDGLLLPGGLGTWMIRGHPGLRALIQEMHDLGKPVGAIGRGPKLLMSADVLGGHTITCAPAMRDDIIHSVAPVRYQDLPVVQDGHLLTCAGTEDLPQFMNALLTAYGVSRA